MLIVQAQDALVPETPLDALLEHILIYYNGGALGAKIAGRRKHHTRGNLGSVNKVCIVSSGRSLASGAFLMILYRVQAVTMPDAPLIGGNIRECADGGLKVLLLLLAQPIHICPHYLLLLVFFSKAPFQKVGHILFCLSSGVIK